MTATTNTIVVEKPNGSITEYSGVLYAEEGIDPQNGQKGVVAQTIGLNEGTEDVVFLEGSLVGIYDDVSDEPIVPEYRDFIKAQITRHSKQA